MVDKDKSKLNRVFFELENDIIYDIFRLSDLKLMSSPAFLCDQRTTVLFFFVIQFMGTVRTFSCKVIHIKIHLMRHCSCVAFFADYAVVISCFGANHKMPLKKLRIVVVI